MNKFDSAITHVIEPALPGSAVVVMVGGARRNTRLYAFRLAAVPSVSPGTGSITPSEAHELHILQRTDEAFTVQMPDGPLSAWAFQLDPEFDLQRAWVVNRPRLDWPLTCRFLEDNKPEEQSTYNNTMIQVAPNRLLLLYDHGSNSGKIPEYSGPQRIIGHYIDIAIE